MPISTIRRPGPVLGAFFLAGALACDRPDSPAGPDEANLRSATAGASLTQVYRAKLQPLNGEVSFRPVTGVALVKVKDGRLSVQINARGLEPGIPHPQHIHGFIPATAGQCPGPDADVNGDGVIDVLEGLPDYGPILLTLDGNLADGAGTDVASLPNPDNQGGAIQYSAEAPLADVTAGVGTDLELGQRHIVLHGVNPATPLDQAASIGGLPAWLTLPIACGELEPAG